MVYAALAPLYDRIMSHVEYGAWVRLINRVAADHLPPDRRAVLEVGGGTGVLGAQLARAGFRYHGSDRSRAMCAQARCRGLPFFCADARFLPLKRRFDILLFLYDGINYFLDMSDYDRFLRQAHSVLADGGLLLFDVTTEANSLTHFRDYLDFDDFGHAAYVRHSYYDSALRMQYNDFTIFVRANSAADLFSRHTEHHAQMVPPVIDIVKAIPEELFEVVGVWDGFTTRRYSSRSTRVHFLLKRAAS
jgi:SAM-dependent methyltransferase